MLGLFFQSPPVPLYLDPNQPLVLACDASPFWLGAVLSHRFNDGTEKPISYASRTLAAAVKKYSQLDKEAWPSFLECSTTTSISMEVSSSYYLTTNH